MFVFSTTSDTMEIFLDSVYSPLSGMSCVYLTHLMRLHTPGEPGTDSVTFVFLRHSPLSMLVVRW